MARVWIVGGTEAAAEALAEEASLTGPQVAHLSWEMLEQRWREAPQVQLVLVEWPADDADAVRHLATLRHLSEADLWATVRDGTGSQAAVDAGVSVTLRRPLRPQAIKLSVEHLLDRPLPSDAVLPSGVVAVREWRFDRLAALHTEMSAATGDETLADLIVGGAGELLGAVVVLRLFQRPGVPEMIRGWGDWDGADLQRLAGPEAEAAARRPGAVGCSNSPLAGSEPVRDRRGAVGRRAMLIPLFYGDAARGLMLLRRDDRPFNGDELSCAELVATQAAARLAHVSEAGAAQGAMMETLLRALEERDAGTLAHSRRAARYTEMLLDEAGIEPQDEGTPDVIRGALLHDVGKIGVPDNALLATGPLSDEQWTALRRHALLSYHMLSVDDYLAGAAEVAYAHHERFDGGGYPRGLAGDAIPFGARVFAVADAFDAMTSTRPYRPALDVDSARDEIERCAGTQFDPQVVEWFCRIYPAIVAKLLAA